jgi:hypothetical protein
MWDSDSDIYYDEEPPDEFQPDLTKQEPYIQQAVDAINEFFRRRKTPFHFRQLQVLFETQFFHITTAQAIYRLKDRGILRTRRFNAGANAVTFVFPSHLLKSQNTKKILMTHMTSKAKTISLYDSPVIGKDLADHFESLVKHELRSNNLTIVDTHSNEYKNRKWKNSKANLYFIAEHPDGRAFGVQAKNELKPIEKEELEEQLEICSYLNIKPIFIVRYMPFSFTHLIKRQQGFLLVIGNQLWPLGYRKRCETIKTKMSISANVVSEKLKELAPKLRSEWPIEIRTDIPENHSKRLRHWITTGKYPLPTAKNTATMSRRRQA